MLDFTRRLKFQQIINHLYVTLHCLIRVTIMRNFWNVHSLSISAQSPTVMPQAVKSSAWPAQFRKSNSLIWPGLQATDPTAGRPGLSGTPPFKWPQWARVRAGERKFMVLNQLSTSSLNWFSMQCSLNSQVVGAVQFPLGNPTGFHRWEV
ncbi:hypothetical protein BDD12DRAFT_800774 [Trichophaea hybrida]|nr:hypothetical protein BDD12DRAFT_800774 [Trichophaea hybrida]